MLLDVSSICTVIYSSVVNQCSGMHLPLLCTVWQMKDNLKKEKKYIFFLNFIGLFYIIYYVYGTFYSIYIVFSVNKTYENYQLWINLQKWPKASVLGVFWAYFHLKFYLVLLSRVMKSNHDFHAKNNHFGIF